MTYNNIYEKFLIEYDKASVTSSYPSLTKYEACAILDKAYLALIGQKFTGNNIRRSGFESDIKSISDLQGLLTTEMIPAEGASSLSDNEVIFILDPDETLYIINMFVYISGKYEPAIPVDHSTANRFRKTSYNNPWLKRPVFYVEGNKIHVLYDLENPVSGTDGRLTYIKKPYLFTDSEDST